MRHIIFCLISFLATTSIASADQTTEHWELKTSKLTYRIEHPLKTAEGVSTAAKGKGNCGPSTCHFLIALPVKSFDSGDSNRDLHMIETTRGALYPMIVVRASTRKTDFMNNRQISVDLDIEFAGKTKKYSAVPFELTNLGETTVRLKGTIPLKLSDFDIPPPSLLTMKVKDLIPIKVESTWMRK